MELLIPGLILVALMVYASTRIKKTAAAAFEAETVETDDFIIQKPEGLLTVLNGDERYAFESYSKEFGGEGAENFRKATAYLRIIDSASIEQAVADLRDPDDEPVSDIGEVIGDNRYRVIEIKRVVSGIEFRVFYKLAAKAGKVYEFQVTVISETTDEFMRNIETMLNGFEVK